MKYYEIQFQIQPYNEDVCDVLSSLLADTGFETFVPTGTGITGYVQQTLFSQEATDDLLSNFPIPGYSITYHSQEAPDEDWNQTWEEEGFQPVSIDNLVCVHDTKHIPETSCLYDITINPRMAFGTGTHPTTQQILRQLCTMPLEGLRIIDAGCGTGVLGFLCLKRGAKEVLAYDIDEWSVENTKINAALNGIGNIEVKEGDASVLPQTADYDLLIANINRNILLNDMERFAAALRPVSHILLSGFYDTDAPLLIEKGKELGFCVEKQSTQDGWTMLLLQRLF